MQHVHELSGLASTLLLPIVLGAQADPAPCTYDVCALRALSRSLWWYNCHLPR